MLRRYPFVLWFRSATGSTAEFVLLGSRPGADIRMYFQCHFYRSLCARLQLTSCVRKHRIFLHQDDHTERPALPFTTAQGNRDQMKSSYSEGACSLLRSSDNLEVPPRSSVSASQSAIFRLVTGNRHRPFSDQQNEKGPSKTVKEPCLLGIVASSACDCKQDA